MCAVDKELIVEQGKTFSMTFECVDTSEELVTQGESIGSTPPLFL